MDKHISVLLLLLLLLFEPGFFNFVFAQGGPPPPPPEPIPIDGGIGALIVAGVGYAAKKLYSSKNYTNKL